MTMFENEASRCHGIFDTIKGQLQPGTLVTYLLGAHKYYLETDKRLIKLFEPEVDTLKVARPNIHCKQCGYQVYLSTPTLTWKHCKTDGVECIK